MKGSNEEIQRKADRCEHFAFYCGALVAVGLMAEAGLAVFYPEFDLQPISAAIQMRYWLDLHGVSDVIKRWGVFTATALVLLGVVGEVLYGRSGARYANELQHRAEAETNRLRKKHGYRELSEENCKGMEAIRGTLSKIAIIPYSDTESRMFATQFAIVLESVDIPIEIDLGYAGSGGNGLLVVVPSGVCTDPKEFALTKAIEATGFKTTSEFRKLGSYSTIPADVPIIQVGEKYIPFDELPYVSRLPRADKWIKL